MSRPTLLCFNVSASKLPKLRMACMSAAVLLQVIPSESFPQPLGALCGLMAPQADLPAPEAPFTGEMLVMANLSRPQAERLLSALRQSKQRFPLKAVLTPTNVHWDCAKLYQELTAEREAIARGETDHHTAE